ncbi:hypothetical protein BD769DRAFT_1663054 [Suillus cothurnatus]|nr:hypothetical protein BD769DRAFT_1663054 [Suillus cothurnatus]
MSTPVDTSLAGLKEITAQIVGIISSGWQILAGNAHMALTSQVTELAQVVRDHGKGPHIPSIMFYCSKELMRVQAMTPWVWPNWHSIGFDDLCLMKHAWCPKILAWEALGDHSFDLPVTVPPSVGPNPVDLPSSPIVTDNATGFSTNTTTESQAMVKDKGKGKADLEPEVDGSRKRKSPMISALPSQPPKLAMKGRKWVKSMMKTQSISASGVLDVVLPLLSTLDTRIPGSPHSPWSPKKQTFGPVSCTVGSLPGATDTSSHLEVIESPQSMSTIPVEAPPVIDTGDILIPRLLTPVALHKSQGQEDQHPLFVMCLLLGVSMSPPASALPALIDLSMTGMASAIEGLMFEPTQGHPEDPHTSDNMVDPDDPGNLAPEYNSDDIDIEVKVEEDVDIAT